MIQRPIGKPIGKLFRVRVGKPLQKVKGNLSGHTPIRTYMIVLTYITDGE
jgi:hypothetical protein